MEAPLVRLDIADNIEARRDEPGAKVRIQPLLGSEEAEGAVDAVQI